MKNPMEIREIFKQKFELPRDDFSDPIDIKDVEIGFAVYKNQKDLRRENFKSIFKLYIKKEEPSKEDDKKSIIITASYGKVTDDGLVTYTSDLNDFKRERNWPVDLISKDDFFFNIKTHNFFYKEKDEYKIISGKEILDKVNSWHLKTTKKIEGFPLRTKSWFFHTLLAGFLKMIFYISSGIQYLISGKNVSFYDIKQDTISPPAHSGKTIKIFDYIVEVRIAVVYVWLHLIAYFVFYYFNWRPQILIAIFKNNFLIVMYVIFSLSLADSVLSKLPRKYLMKQWLTFIQEKSLQAAYRQFKLN